MHKIYVKLET